MSWSRTGYNLIAWPPYWAKTIGVVALTYVAAIAARAKTWRANSLPILSASLNVCALLVNLVEILPAAPFRKRPIFVLRAE